MFNGLLEPNCFASIFFTPTSSRIVRTDPPAITPEPGADGLMITLAAPERPVIRCGIELSFVIGTLIRCFFPSVTAFLTAPITSLALPTPTPTCPFSFPIIKIDGKTLILNVGYSHQVKIVSPEGIKLSVEGNTNVTVSGLDKELVGQIAANIRLVRPPEPYKGKGIRYHGEYVRKKVGKAGKK